MLFQRDVIRIQKILSIHYYVVIMTVYVLMNRALNVNQIVNFLVLCQQYHIYFSYWYSVQFYAISVDLKEAKLIQKMPSNILSLNALNVFICSDNFILER